MIQDEALQAFIVESRDLLERMEAALLVIEQQPDDVETINAIFRAAHTIKGSSGIFGLDGIVAFTHVAESVLDEVRAGRLRFDHDLATVMLGSCDHIRRLVDLVAEERQPDAACAAEGAGLTARLERWLAVEASTAAAPVVAAAAAAPGAAPAHGDRPAHWHLSLRFGPETIRDGFDPLSFLRYLGRLGTLQQVEPLTHRVPLLSALEADDCHLAFEIAFRSDADAATLEQVFEFVREDSRIVVIPPGSGDARYRALACDAGDADAAPDETVIEALLRCGSLGSREAPPAPAAAEGRRTEPGDAQDAEHAVATAAPSREARSAAPAGGGDTQVLRVDAAKLDRLINLVGELLIAGAGASLTARQQKNKPLIQATAVVARMMEEVRDSALSLRMVQIGATFNRFQRMVRDISQELGKDIALRITGAETELDKTVVERLADPLTHLVRNAMDHGIESAEQRERAGKPVQGTVHLHAHHEAGHVVVEVSDDGRGLSRDRIFQVAVERGLIPADASLTDQEVYQLIFQPGFSTAEQVSNLSGRGVGMDVVSRNIAALRGSIAIETALGEGTTVRLRLPLTLAIIDGFLLGVGGASYVVPLNAVVECIELDPRRDDGRDWLDLRGRPLPLLRLRTLYRVEGHPGRRQNVVVVRLGDQHIGLVVDQLLGELQTVIRPVGRLFAGVPGISGFTILGSGAVALLLDIASLPTPAEPGRRTGETAVVGSPVHPHHDALA